MYFSSIIFTEAGGITQKDKHSVRSHEIKILTNKCGFSGLKIAHVRSSREALNLS